MPVSGQVIGGICEIKEQIGQGAFGSIWRGTSVGDGIGLPGAQFAVKFEACDSPYPQLSNECSAYRALEMQCRDHNLVGFPRLVWAGDVDGTHHAMITTLLGPSLEDLLNYVNRRLSKRTVFQVAVQLLARLQAIHQAGIVHCDIKPENVLIGLDELREPSQTLHLIDFGLSRIAGGDSGERAFSPAKPAAALAADISSEAVSAVASSDHARSGGATVEFRGSVRFASAGALRHQPQSQRDDLESLGFMLVYLLRQGTLPWEMKEKVLVGLHHQRGEDHQFYGNMGVNENARAQSAASLVERKLAMPVAEIVADLPAEMRSYFELVRAIDPGSVVDYGALRALFHSVTVSGAGQQHPQSEFDWSDAKHVLRRGSRGYLPVHLQPYMDKQIREESSKVREGVERMKRQMQAATLARQRQTFSAAAAAPPPVRVEESTSAARGVGKDGSRFEAVAQVGYLGLSLRQDASGSAIYVEAFDEAETEALSAYTAAAGHETRILPRDKLLSVGGTALQGKSVKEAIELIRSTARPVKLILCRTCTRTRQ